MMFTFIFSGLHFVTFSVLAILIVFAMLVLYALRTKGDVFAELTHGKTTVRFDARERARKVYRK